MPRLTAKDFAPELLELYDGYVHGRLSRREFLDRAAVFAVGGLTAAGILASLSPDYALASQVSFTDPDIIAEYIPYLSPNGHGQVQHPGQSGLSGSESTNRIRFTSQAPPHNPTTLLETWAVCNC